MKTIIFILMLFFTTTASADVFVSGYTKKDGTYINPYYRTSPNNTITDNYSYKNNVNPYNPKPTWEKPRNDFYNPKPRGQYQSPFYKY